MCYLGPDEMVHAIELKCQWNKKGARERLVEEKAMQKYSKR